MVVEYEVPLFFDAGKAVDAVGDTLRDINATMKQMGFDGELVVGKEVGVIRVGMESVLTPEDREKLRRIVAEQMADLPVRVQAVRLRADREAE